MSRPRTPTAVLEARGAYINHPERRADRVNEPKPIGKLGGPPKTFSPEERKLWNELKRIAPPGVLADCDRWTVETACILMAKQRARTITNTERAQLIQLLSRMGMTPSDRSKVAAIPQDDARPEDPWAEFSGSENPQ